MEFRTMGNKANPAILFFHAMGVTGDSSVPVAEHLQEKYYCIMPTSTVYCAEQKYRSKSDEVQQIVDFLKKQKIKEIQLVHMQYQIRNPKGFAEMLMSIIETGKLPRLPFIK